jgi:hypothetical protein
MPMPATINHIKILSQDLSTQESENPSQPCLEVLIVMRVRKFNPIPINVCCGKPSLRNVRPEVGRSNRTVDLQCNCFAREG